MEKNVIAIVMAGGLGKRMESDIPKVLHKLNDIPMICHILLKLNQHNVNINRILVVVGKYKDLIQTTIQKYVDLPNISYIYQEEPLGTGHAIQCCREELIKYPYSDVLILSGDVPLLSIDTMCNLLNNPNTVKLITTNMENPQGYGRIVIENGSFVKIIEHKDCSEKQLLITMINSGIYCIRSDLLCKHLPYLQNNNNQQEYYLTDIIEIIKKEENIEIGILEIEKDKQIEIMGVNTLNQLNELELLVNITPFNVF